FRVVRVVRGSPSSESLSTKHSPILPVGDERLLHFPISLSRCFVRLAALKESSYATFQSRSLATVPKVLLGVSHAWAGAGPEPGAVSRWVLRADGAADATRLQGDGRTGTGSHRESR